LVRVGSDRDRHGSERGTTFPFFAEQAGGAVVIAGAAVIGIIPEIKTAVRATGLAGRAGLHAVSVQAELAGGAGIAAVPAVIAVSPYVNTGIIALDPV
jgi:hypothetical protein